MSLKYGRHLKIKIRIIIELVDFCNYEDFEHNLIWNDISTLDYITAAMVWNPNFGKVVTFQQTLNIFRSLM